MVLVYYESLKLVNEKGIRRIVFFLILIGIYCFLVDEGVKIVFIIVIKFLDKNFSSFDLILWVLDEKIYIVYKEKYKKLLEI